MPGIKKRKVCEGHCKETKYYVEFRMGHGSRVGACRACELEYGRLITCRHCKETKHAYTSYEGRKQICISCTVVPKRVKKRIKQAGLFGEYMYLMRGRDWNQVISPHVLHAAEA